LANCGACENVFSQQVRAVFYCSNKREGDMTTTITALAPDVGNLDRRAALVFGVAAASILGGADAHAQGAAGAIKTYNPPNVAAPLGPYSHAVEAPPNARWLYIAGQIGNAPDGSMVADVEGQAEQCWKNIEAILAAADVGVENLVSPRWRGRRYCLRSKPWQQRLRTRDRHSLLAARIHLGQMLGCPTRSWHVV
jgi:Endoribonuclease L-PSP